MRPGLRWLLVLTVLLSALAIWWPEPPVRVAGEPVDVLMASQAEAGRTTDPASAASTRVPLGETLPRPTLEAAPFDPFVGVPPPPPPPPAPPVQVTAAVPVLASPPPAAPPMTYRYLGQMTDPSGERKVYLAKGDTAVAVTVGTRLDEGYVVQTMDAAGVRLHYPPLDAHAVIPVPAQEPATEVPVAQPMATPPILR